LVGLADRGKPRECQYSQGGKAGGLAPTLVTQLVLESAEVGFHKGLASQDHAIGEEAIRDQRVGQYPYAAKGLQSGASAAQIFRPRGTRGRW
jgi:hypothetical protein